MFYVYILQSQFSGKRYIGQTDDLNRRIIEHNTKSHNARKFTSKHAGPWILIHSECFDTRTQAMNREKWLKSGIGRNWINEQFGKASPPEAD
jgi:putative endonuclease